MRAQILKGIGEIEYTEVEKPVPGCDEALVRITRCGICGSDIPRIYKTGAHNMPLIPGHEMTGVVEACARRPELVGKRVGIFPLIPCHNCIQCSNGHYEMCTNYDYLGSRSDGGFAEYVKVPVWNLLSIPDSVTDEEAAMLEPMAVAVHAIRQMGLIGEDVDETVLKQKSDSQNIVVCGLGTIGLLVTLFLKNAGYRNVFCIGNKDVQLDKARAMLVPAEDFCDIRTTDEGRYISEKTDGSNADFYFECIGRSENYAQAINCTGPYGKIMLVGNPASDMAVTRNTYWKILRNQLTIYGTWNSRFNGIDGAGDDWRYVIDCLTDWNMDFRPSDLITHDFPLAKLSEGLEIMRDKKEEYIKIMCNIT